MVKNGDVENIFAKLKDKIQAINLWTLFELILPFYLGFLVVYTYLTGLDYFGVSFHEWLGLILAYLPAMIVFVPVVGKMIGFSDYRFKVLVHVIVIGSTAVLNGLIVRASGIFTLLTPSPMSLTQIIINYTIQSVPSMLIIIGAVMNIYDLSTPFLKEFSSVREEVQQGNLSVRITNPGMLSDSAFGPVSTLINHILETTSTAIYSLKDTSSLLTAISNEIASLASETNAATEAVASSTTALTKGSNSQAEAMMHVTEVMESLQSQLTEVISKIEKNANESTEIAQLTKILSLNASIEASRAGDGARGFTVIAENIRRLANDSKRNSEEISGVVKVVTESFGETFSEVKERIDEVSSIAEENAASTEEISASIQELAANMERLADAAQTLAARAEETQQIIEGYQV